MGNRQTRIKTGGTTRPQRTQNVGCETAGRKIEGIEETFEVEGHVGAPESKRVVTESTHITTALYKYRFGRRSLESLVSG